MSERTPREEDTARLFLEDMKQVRASLGEDREAQSRLIDRLKCVSRILSARNAQLGRPFDSAELEDISQDTVLTIWNKRHEFHGKSSFESWVYPFCYYVLMNRVRMLRRAPVVLHESAVENIPAIEPVDFSHIHQALAKLAPDEAEVIRARNFEQLGFPQIGERLGITQSMAKHRYYKGLDRLRALLDPNERS